MKKSIIKLMPIGGQAENGKSMYCLEIDDNWFIIDASEYERIFWSNKTFRKKFLDWNNKRTLNDKTDFFYNEIAKPFCEAITNTRRVSLFDIENELIDFVGTQRI